MTARGATAIFSLGLLAAALLLAVRVMDPPAEVRSRRLDDRRVEDLRRISSEVRVFHARRSALPASLDDLAGEGLTAFERRDPEHGTTYGYRVIGSSDYELCATFSAGQPDSAPWRDLAWAHRAGRQCFTREVRRLKGEV